MKHSDAAITFRKVQRQPRRRHQPPINLRATTIIHPQSHYQFINQLNKYDHQHHPPVTSAIAHALRATQNPAAANCRAPGPLPQPPGPKSKNHFAIFRPAQRVDRNRTRTLNLFRHTLRRGALIHATGTAPPPHPTTPHHWDGTCTAAAAASLSPQLPWRRWTTTLQTCAYALTHTCTHAHTHVEHV